jgi:hypothetical protein
MDTGFHPTSIEEVETEHSRRAKAARAANYLQGPIRICDIQDATKLGGACLALLLAIYFRRDVIKQEAVTLPSGFLADFGIDKTAKSRGLKLLEQAKLINIKRAAGHTAVVELRAKKRKARK